jgi:hypothetical protein
VSLRPLTGWILAQAAGQPLDSVFRIINEESRRPVESPTVRALRDGVIVGLANHSLLISKDEKAMPTTDKTLRVLVVNGMRDGADALGLLLEELGNQVHVIYGV